MGCACSAKVLNTKTVPQFSMDDIQIIKTTKNTLLFLDVNEPFLYQMQSLLSEVSREGDSTNQKKEAVQLAK